MGADLLFAINEIKKTREEARAKALTIVENRAIEDVIETLINDIGRWEFDRDDVDKQEVLEYLNDCIDTVYNSKKSRTCGWFMVDENRVFYITAGLSWGDEPSPEYDAFRVCNEFELTV